jgi:hypothetical protein
MGQPARVKSIDALQSMSAALECFSDGARSALDDLEVEIQRALQWIGVDCRQYWKQEVHRSWDRVIEAKQQLERAQMTRRIQEERASCIEEKKALEQAKRRLELARSKVEAVGHWSITIERSVNEYLALRTHVVNWLESDFPKAVAALERMLTALETYVRLETPADELATIVEQGGASAAEAQVADPSKNAPDETSKNNHDINAAQDSS